MAEQVTEPLLVCVNGFLLTSLNLITFVICVQTEKAFLKQPKVFLWYVLIFFILFSPAADVHNRDLSAFFFLLWIFFYSIIFGCILEIAAQRSLGKERDLERAVIATSKVLD